MLKIKIVNKPKYIDMIGQDYQDMIGQDYQDITNSNIELQNDKSYEFQNCQYYIQYNFSLCFDRDTNLVVNETLELIKKLVDGSPETLYFRADYGDKTIDYSVTSLSLDGETRCVIFCV